MIVDCSDVSVEWPIPMREKMSPTTCHVLIDTGPMTNPATMATTSATPVHNVTIATRRLVGGFVLSPSSRAWCS